MRTPICLGLIFCCAALGQTTRLDVTQFVVVGEGLAAGMADFALRDVYQERAFPVLIARQMQTLFPIPAIQSPGLGSAPGFPVLPVRAPGPHQTTVRKQFPPPLFVFNLSVPNYRLRDALTRRPASPLVQADPQATLVNFILGFPALILGDDKPRWTQIEYARNLSPTLAIVELGYFDVLEPAVLNDASLLPEVSAFRADYSRLLAELGSSHPTILATTIPDPFDTAYFTTLSSATRLVGAPASVLARLYGLHADDLITVPGLKTMASQITSEKISTLPAGSIVSAATAAAVKARVAALNTEIAALAGEHGATVYDLNAWFRRARESGISAAGKLLTSEYLGGIYTLNGYYPGATAHALIANEMLGLLNSTFGSSFPLVDVQAAAVDDPAVRFTPARKDPAEREVAQ